MKRVRLTKVDLLSIGLCLVAILPGLLVYDRLPEEIATHFGLDGNPNGYSSRLFAVVGLPLVVALVQTVYCITTNLFRKEKGMSRAEKVIRFLIPVVLYAMQIFMLMYAMGKATDMMTFLGAIVTVLFLVLGNYLPKVRRTTFFGIRTPHTLANEEVWDKTHRFAGVLHVIAGIICMIMTVTGMNGVFLLVLLALTIGIPFIYSEILYRRAKAVTDSRNNTFGGEESKEDVAGDS